MYLPLHPKQNVDAVDVDYIMDTCPYLELPPIPPPPRLVPQEVAPFDEERAMKLVPRARSVEEAAYTILNTSGVRLFAVSPTWDPEPIAELLPTVEYSIRSTMSSLEANYAIARSTS